jgi:hypothetical protein
MLTNNPALYDASIKLAGGKVMFKWLLNVGVPTLHYLRAGRMSDGKKAELLHAISFHMYRSTTHKVNCVLISLIALLSTCATHPVIADIVRACTSFSWTGAPGGLAFGDRCCELLNNYQGARDGKFAAFEKALQYTPDLAALLHVSQAWERAIYGDNAINDPVTQSLLNGALVVRNELRSKLGTDLTVPSTHNPFWHTGNPVCLAQGSERLNRPWDFRWSVAYGKAAGKGRTQTESYDAYVKRVMSDMMFPEEDEQV